MSGIRIDNLNGEQQGRLTEILLGRSDFAAFTVDSNGRRLTLWAMSDSALERVETRMGVESPPPETYTPPPPPVVPITTGARATVPQPRPERPRG